MSSACVEGLDSLTIEQAELAVLAYLRGAAKMNGQSHAEYIATMRSLLEKSRIVTDELDAFSWYLRGNAFLTIGLYADATNCYERCLEMQPDH